MPSLNNLIMFKECVNYRDNGSRVTIRGSTTTAPEMADNDYSTSSSENDVDIDISDGSSATRVDAIYVKFKAGTLTSYTATPTGGSGSAVTRTVPTEIDDYNGERVGLEVGGFSHDLFLLDSHFTATDVRLQFTGTDLEIAEIMLLEVFQDVDANKSEIVALEPVSAERAAEIDTDATGSVARLTGVGNAREKRELTVAVIAVPDETLITDVDECVYALEVNKRFVMGLPFSEDPSGVFPAIVSSTRVSVRYRSDSKFHGYTVNFQVMEV